MMTTSPVSQMNKCTPKCQQVIATGVSALALRGFQKQMRLPLRLFRDSRENQRRACARECHFVTAQIATCCLVFDVFVNTDVISNSLELCL